MEARESTRKRLESCLPKGHEDHVAGKGYNSMTRYNLVHKFIPMPQAMKILDAKAAAVDKEWKKLETTPAWQPDKGIEQKKGGYSGSTKRQKESPLCCIDGHLSSQNAEEEPKNKSFKDESYSEVTL